MPVYRVKFFTTLYVEASSEAEAVDIASDCVGEEADAGASILDTVVKLSKSDIPKLDKDVLESKPWRVSPGDSDTKEVSEKTIKELLGDRKKPN